MILEQAKAIKGWMSEIELKFLASTACSSSCIIEVGSYQGRSSRVLADNTPGKVYCCDPWAGDYYNEDGSIHGIKTNVRDRFESNLRDHLASGKVVIIQKEFNEVEWNNRPDFIFLDGDHRYSTVIQELSKAWNILESGGILAGHDYGRNDWPGVKRAVDEYFGTLGVDIVDTIWWKRKLR